MDFPLTITDEQQLNRLIMEISRFNIKETVTEMLIQTGQLTEYITKSEAGKQVNSDYRVEQAIKKGELKFVAKGRNRMINRIEFNNWKKIDSLL